jgi:hypothetical protein
MRPCNLSAEIEEDIMTNTEKPVPENSAEHRRRQSLLEQLVRPVPNPALLAEEQRRDAEQNADLEQKGEAATVAAEKITRAKEAAEAQARESMGVEIKGGDQERVREQARLKRAHDQSVIDSQVARQKQEAKIAAETKALREKQDAAMKARQPWPHTL